MTDKEKFIANKMRILVGEEGYDRAQAFAISNSLYDREHNKKQQGGSIYNYNRTGDQNITPSDVNTINQMTGIEFTPEFSNSYFSKSVEKQVPITTPPVNFSQLPIKDITSDGQWTNRKVWRTQKPEWFVGKREPIEGQDYTTIPYSKWSEYQSSPEYRQYSSPQQGSLAVMQVGGQAWNFNPQPLPQNIDYSFNPQYAPSPYVYESMYTPNLPAPTFGGNNFQYNPSAVGTAMPSDILNKQEQMTLAANTGSGITSPEYNDTTRYNVSQLYGGVDLEGALAYAGQGFGSGNAGQAGLGTALSVLKGGRNFLTGFATGKENKRVKEEQYNDLFNPNTRYTPLQQGGGIDIPESHRGLFTEQAHRAGYKDVQAFAKHVLANKDRYDTTTTRRATFAQNFGGNQMQQGGEAELSNAEMLTGKYVTDEGQGNYEVEGNEYIKRAQTGEVQQVVGEAHVKNGKINGGVDVTLENGDKVLSTYTKIPAKDIKELKDRYNISLRKGATFADAQKAYDKKLGIQKETDNLTKLIEKYGENTNVKDETTRRLNDVVMSKEIATAKKKLDLLGTPQSMMFEDLFDIQESLVKKGSPGELLDKDGKPIAKEGVEMNYQQGGEVANLANKFGISIERAHELLTMQQGGVSEEQPAEGGITQEQVMQFVVESLQAGATPDQVIEQLIQNGIPHQDAMMIIQQVTQQAQPSQEQMTGEELPVAQEGGEKQYMQTAGTADTGFSFSTRYTPELKGYEVKGSSVVDKDKLENVEDIQSYTGAGYGKQMANVEDLMKVHSWYFDTPEKKEKFREAAKKEGTQEEIINFQNAYNKELRNRAEKAGIDKTEANKIVEEVGFSGKGVKKFDGLAGAFTTTRPLYDFTKVDGKVEVKETPVVGEQKQVITEQRNITKNVLPMFAQNLNLAPSALDPIVKEQIALGRMESVKTTVEPMLAEQERMRQTDVNRYQNSGLSIQQQEALLAQGLASSQMAANDAIAKVEQANQASQMQADQFNIGQRAKEDITNSQYNQVYQNQVLGGLNAYENALRGYYTEQNRQGAQNYRDVESINLLNAPNSQYAYLPGVGIEFLNSRPETPKINTLAADKYKNMTAEQIDKYIKDEIEKSRASGFKK